MRQRLWLAVAVADGLVAVGGVLVLVALSRVFGSTVGLAPQPSAGAEELVALAGLTLVALAPLAAARLTGNPVRAGVSAAVAGLVAVWLAVIFDPTDGSLMPLTLGVAVAASIALAGIDGRRLGRRAVAVLIVTGVAVVVPSGAGEAVVVLLAFPAVALADHVGAA